MAQSQSHHPRNKVARALEMSFRGATAPALGPKRSSTGIGRDIRGTNARGGLHPSDLLDATSCTTRVPETVAALHNGSGQSQRKGNPGSRADPDDHAGSGTVLPEEPALLLW
jgi:hypothetical protein